MNNIIKADKECEDIDSVYEISNHAAKRIDSMIAANTFVMADIKIADEVILCINIGNTNTICALGTKKDNYQMSIPTKEICREEIFMRFLEEEFGTGIWRLLAGSIISSVVPEKTSVIINAVCQKTNKQPQLIDISKCVIDFSEYKSGLGEDRIVCCCAAAIKYPAPFIVIDLGTATTINVINIDNIFLGGAILTGIQTGLNALTGQTAQLPKVNDFSYAPVIGNDTQKSLVSGAVIGTICAIEGYINRIQAELKIRPTVIITGGNAPLIIPYCSFDLIYEPSLLTDGLFELY